MRVGAAPSVADEYIISHRTHRCFVIAFVQEALADMKKVLATGLHLSCWQACSSYAHSRHSRCCVSTQSSSEIPLIFKIAQRCRETHILRASKVHDTAFLCCRSFRRASLSQGSRMVQFCSGPESGDKGVGDRAPLGFKV